MLDISIVGAGRMGGALALALDRAGYDVSRIVFRTAPPDDGFLSQFTRRPDVSSISEGGSIASDAVFITTQDSEIASAAIELEALIQGSSTVFITSGAQSSKSITNLRNRGARIGSIHPLVSVSDPVQGADRLKGAFFCVEGDLDAVNLAEVIVRSLGGRSFTIPTDKKPLYHAAAVTSSGHLVALIDIAIGMLEKCGLDVEQGKTILLPLIESTVENLKGQTLEESLTGTYARGDLNTFESHLAALRNNEDEKVTRTYLDLALRSLEIAERRDGSRESLMELKERVLIAKREVG